MLKFRNIPTVSFWWRLIGHGINDTPALVISSLGVWGVSFYLFSSLESLLITKALTSIFLGVFTEGWVMLGVLDIIWSMAKSSEMSVTVHKNWFWMPLLCGSMLIFPYSLDQSILTPAMLYSAKAGLLLIFISLGACRTSALSYCFY